MCFLFFFCFGMSFSYGQCTASIADGNGSFTDNQIGWSSPSANNTVQAAPAPEGSSSDGGAYLRLATTGNNELVNITMGGLTNGGMYIVDWEAIHGLVSTYTNYLNGATYTVTILEGTTAIFSEDFTITDPTAWVAQSVSFTSSATDLIFRISLLGTDFNAGTYKMGIDGMSITCNGTTRPCDLVAPSYTKKI